MNALRRAGVLYLSIQSAGAALWWIGLCVFPSLRPLYLPFIASPSVFFAVGAPDVALYVGAGFVAAYALAKRKRWATTVIALHTGAVCYAGLYCLALSLSSGAGWRATALMTPSLLFSPFLLARLYREAETTP